MEAIEALINEIESEILRAKKAAFSNNDIILNRQTMLSLVTRFRASYPIVLKEAEQIKKERDEILSKAESYANDTMDKAEERAKTLIAETEIVKKAQAEAQSMCAEAEEYYRRTEYDARSLAFSILDSTEKTMSESMQILNDKKRKLVEE